MYKEEKKTVLITGSTGDIGKRVAVALAHNDIRLILHYHKNEKMAKEMYSTLHKKSEIEIYQVDLSSKEEVKSFYKQISKRYKRIDVIINIAGICDDMAMLNMSYESWLNVINTNLSSIFLVCHYFTRLMLENGGKIINISSYMGIVGSARQCNYSASKAGIIGLTKSLAKELGQFNIAVNSICPGFISTQMNCMEPQKMHRAQEKSVLSIKYALSDLVEVINLLASDKIKGISGQNFILDSRIL